MERALELAKKARGWTNPNPLVGAVIVKDGKVIAEGYHERIGAWHAERNALNQLDSSVDLSNASMYVTLEPCCHEGRTPPCTQVIIDSGIKHLVIATLDPNAIVARKGVKQLEEAGITVECGLLEEESRQMNEIFNHFITTQRPFVTLKYAMTMDGKIATRSKLSKWITSQSARAHVHEERQAHASIMVGVGTVLKDNPSLTVRREGKESSKLVRIICDSQLRTPLDSTVVETATDAPTWIATTVEDTRKYQDYLDKGCFILLTKKTESGQVDLNDLMVRLGEREIDSVYLEGGSQLNWSALESGIVQRVHTYIAPKLFGGQAALSPISGLGVDQPSDAFQLTIRKVQMFEPDILIESEVN